MTQVRKKELFRFRLQTLFIVFTAAVVCVGANLAVQRLMGFPVGPFDNTALALYALAHLPFSLVIALGGAILFERRRENARAAGLALAASTTAIAWDIFWPWVDLKFRT